MDMHVNFLPPELLCAIFCLLPIRDLLRAGRVCAKWYKARQSAGWKVHKLTLVIGGKLYDGYPDFAVGFRRNGILKDDGSFMFPKPEYPTFHFVHFKWLDLTGLIRLTVLFPNVSTLEIACQHSTMYELCAVTILLRLWQAKLVSLKFEPVFISRPIYGPRPYVEYFIRKIPTQISGPLIEAINSLSALKHLSLLFRSTYFGAIQLDLPILAQLDQFCLKSADLTDVLFDSLRDHTLANPRLCILLDSHMTWYDQQLNQYRRIAPQFKMIYSFNGFCLFQLTELENLCSHFTSLTVLKLNIQHVEPAISIQNLFSNLAKLTQLVHLGLRISLGVGEGDEIEEGENRQNPAPFARLVSLKSLWLYAQTRSHDNLSLLNIPMTMPNLQVIDVIIRGQLIYRCDRCAIHDATEPLMATEQVKSCLSQTMLPLRHCTQLHSITFASNHSGHISLKNLADLSRPLIFE